MANPNVQTREEMWALIQKTDSVAVNALLQLVRKHQEAAADGQWIIAREDQRFLLSLAAQATQKRGRGHLPGLTVNQITSLRKALEPYQEDLWQITRERLGLPDDRPYEREDEYEPGCEVIDPNRLQFCGCGKLARVQHMGKYYCMVCRNALDEPKYDLRDLNEIVDPR